MGSTTLVTTRIEAATRMIQGQQWTQRLRARKPNRDLQAPPVGIAR